MFGPLPRATAIVMLGWLTALPAAATAAEARPPGPEVVLRNFDFSPVVLTVKAGTAVTWKNLDGEPHTVVSADGQFRSPALDQDDTFTYTFTKPGIYKYLCSIHPHMTASIIVQ